MNRSKFLSIDECLLIIKRTEPNKYSPLLTSRWIDKNKMFVDSILFYTKEVKPILETLVFNKEDFKQRIFIFLNRVKELPVCKKEGCSNVPNLKSILFGYLTYCSIQCKNTDARMIQQIKETNLEKYGCTCTVHNKEIREKVVSTNLERYGVEVPSKNEQIKEKTKQTFLLNYGVDNPNKSKEVRDKTRQTCLDKYGVTSPLGDLEVKERIKETLLERYGVDNPQKNKKIKEKTLNTNVERYGVEYPSQNIEIHGRSMKHGAGKTPMHIHPLYKHLNYQGNLELKFIDSWVKTNASFTIQNGPSIKYTFNGKTKVYHTDFVILYDDGSKDIIEIKAPHQFFKESLKTGQVILKYQAALDYVNSNPEYNRYWFILEGEILSLSDLYNLKEKLILI